MDNGHLFYHDMDLVYQDGYSSKLQLWNNCVQSIIFFCTIHLLKLECYLICNVRYSNIINFICVEKPSIQPANNFYPYIFTIVWGKSLKFLFNFLVYAQWRDIIEHNWQGLVNILSQLGFRSAKSFPNFITVRTDWKYVRSNTLFLVSVFSTLIKLWPI